MGADTSPHSPSADRCVELLGASDPFRGAVESACHVLAALAMSDPADVSEPAWSRAAAAAAAALPPADRSRALLVRQMLESSWGQGRLPSGASGMVLDTALALGESRPSAPSDVAFLAAAARLVPSGSEGLAERLAAAMRRIVAFDDSPCTMWEWEAVASAVGVLATDEFADASVAALRWCVASAVAAGVDSDGRVSAGKDGRPRRVIAWAPDALLGRVLEAAPRLASSLARAPLRVRSPALSAVAWSACNIYLRYRGPPTAAPGGDVSGQVFADAARQACNLLTVVRQARTGADGACAPRLYAVGFVRRLAYDRLAAQAAGGDAAGATLSVILLQNLRKLDPYFSDRCIGSGFGCRAEAGALASAVSLASALLAAERLQPAPPRPTRTPRDPAMQTRGAILAVVCAASVRELVYGSPFFAANAGVLKRPMWDLAGALRDPGLAFSASHVAEALFFIHCCDALAPSAVDGPAMFASQLGKPLPVACLVPFARACCRLAAERGDAELAADACARLCMVIRAGAAPLKSSEAARALACLRPGWTPRHAATGLVAAVVSAWDPGFGSSASPGAPASHVPVVLARLAPWVHVMDEPTADRLTDFACAYTAGEYAQLAQPPTRQQEPLFFREAVACISRPFPRHRQAVAAAMEVALDSAPTLFPDLVMAYASTFTRGGADDAAGKRSAASEVDRLVSARGPLSEHSESGVWWARTVLAFGGE